ncbi:hypothetical protein EVJ58_g9425 [Rhodofomes roseus]|uniref:Uncharacterized protein n=1 Tax=Rhodofomes roseus TaxID=34475 RepID=A0A4Y9XTM3_9APHY|nr:hypothetical protein EVJ58_g9425 [Rhodofomes roseus]
MQERGVGNPWTAEEDRLLTQAVAIHGEVDNWKTVALSVPGRTNKACRKRWLHSLSPNVKKTAWTAEEDQLLLSLYAIHGTKWAVIARNIAGRTDDACSKRYREALDPSLKRDDWTSEEDGKLLHAYTRLGGKWGLIGQELNRSGLACRNRWRMMERKKSAGARQTEPVGASTSLPAPAQAQEQQPLQWQPEVTQTVDPFWEASLVPPSSMPAQFSTPDAQVNRAEHFCACPFHSEPGGLHRNHFQGNHDFQFGPLAMPLSQQDNAAVDSQHQSPYSYDPTQFPTDLDAAFDAPMQSEPQRSALTLDNPSNAFFDMSYVADAGENNRIVPSTEHVPSNEQPFSQIPSNVDLSAGEGVSNKDPSSTALEEIAGPSSAGSTPSPPHAAGQEPVDPPKPDEPRPRTSYYRTPEEKAKMAAPSRRRHRTSPPTRLSSTLPATAE